MFFSLLNDSNITKIKWENPNSTFAWYDRLTVRSSCIITWIMMVLVIISLTYYLHGSISITLPSHAPIISKTWLGDFAEKRLSLWPHNVVSAEVVDLVVAIVGTTSCACAWIVGGNSTLAVGTWYASTLATIQRRKLLALTTRATEE